MADQEGEMEFLQNLLGDHGWVIGLGIRAIRKRSFVHGTLRGAVRSPIRGFVLGAIGGIIRSAVRGTIGSDSGSAVCAHSFCESS